MSEQPLCTVAKNVTEVSNQMFESGFPVKAQWDPSIFLSSLASWMAGSRATLVFSLASVFALALICLRDHERFSRVQRRSLYAPCLRRLRVVHDWPVVCEISSSSEILQLGQLTFTSMTDRLNFFQRDIWWNLICIDDN